ncbi:hypothetical protein [Streptomyces sp. NPDC047869]|uniref:hypothetical protein n=1 Tax=Streptomyces sp. NPDC047869 TaxID=3154709 RepID=UPI0034545A5B
MRTNLSARICHRVDTVKDFLHLSPTAGNWTSPPPTAPCPRACPSPPSATCAPPVRLRSVYLPTEACWQINDLMCTEGLKVRELPAHVNLDKGA